MPELDFNYPDDLKAVPNAWKPASNVDRHPETNNIVPDANGHVPGTCQLKTSTHWLHILACESTLRTRLINCGFSFVE